MPAGSRGGESLCVGSSSTELNRDSSSFQLLDLPDQINQPL